MIQVDFAVVLTVVISASLLLVFAQWIFYNYSRNDALDDQTKYFLHCPYCGYVFFDYRDEQVCTCPRCRSLMGKSEDDQ